MAVIVQKYGGSSVADIDRLRRVADQVVLASQRGDQVVVVVSAMGKTTDNLLSLARQAAAPPGQAQAEGQPPKRELDMLVSTGERVSMALLSIAIQARGHAAVSFTGSQSGIITNDRHFDARIIEVRPHRIEDELARNRIVIVAGYQGMSYRREITTLGRGGSDTTAVALAAALSAERCEIYSDVDGVFSADPRIVPDAQHLPELDYATMQEMAESGAKVLNAQAVEWARKHRVTIAARRTGDALKQSGARETLVGPELSGSARARAVVTQRDVCLLRAPHAALPDLLSAAAELDLYLGDVSAGGAEVAAWLPLGNLPDPAASLAVLSRRLGSELAIEREVSLLSLVGVEVGSAPARVAAALAALPCRTMQLFSQTLRQSVVIAREDLEQAARAWHSALVTADSERLTA